MKTVLRWLGRWLLGVSFVAAALLKIRDPGAFVSDLGHYHLLPSAVVPVVAWFLPWLELVCGGAVLVRRLDRGALVLLSCLCLCFCAALASAWWRGLDLECGCYGRALATAVPVALGRSSALLVLASWLAVDRLDAWAPAPGPGPAS